MTPYRRILLGVGLLASLTAANSVPSAGAKSSTSTSASVTIIAPANVSASASKAYKHLLFHNITGDLTIRIPGVLERVVWPASTHACTSHRNNQDRPEVSAKEDSNDDRATLYWIYDGTLIGEQGTSFAFTRASDPSGAAMAVLAYN